MLGLSMSSLKATEPGIVLLFLNASPGKLVKIAISVFSKFIFRLQKSPYLRRLQNSRYFPQNQ